MDLELRFVASHPRAGTSAASFVFSTRRPLLVTAAQDLLVEQSTSNNGVRACIRASANIEKLMYVGGSGTFLAFLETGYVASYAEHFSGLKLVQERKIGGDGRSVTLGEGSSFGHFALFCKADSPSLWCLPVSENGGLGVPFKLRSDIEGDQDNVNFVDGVLAKVRGKVATKQKSRLRPVVAVSTHASKSFVAAAYTNGIVRVWDIARKEQRSHFDAQLLISEAIVDIALHPTMDTVVCCTSLGRIITFVIHSGMYRRGEEPRLATSKTRDRKRRYRAMAFMEGSPPYLLLLTASRRIVVRMIDNTGLIVNSGRYSKPSRPLSVHGNVVLASQQRSNDDENFEASLSEKEHITFACEPGFGLIGAAFDKGGSVYVFQPRVDGLPAVRRPIVTGLDTGFSQTTGRAFKGPIVMDNDSLIAQNGNLFSYELGNEQVTKLCRLPPGEVRRVEIARDEFGFCMAALVFYYGDDEVNPTYSYGEPENTTRYVVCTKRGESDSWNVSEPSEGRSGCFLNASGHHDRIMILAASGAMASMFSFAGQSPRKGQAVRLTRGVQRFKLNGNRASKIFRAPFASWTSVLYHDVDQKRLAISKNAFGSYGGYDESVRSSEYTSEDGGDSSTNEQYDMDDRTALALQGKEVVIDVRWQALPGANGDRHLGAIMTSQRIYFVRDILEPISKFEFHTIDRISVPFVPPSFSWAGPGVMVLFGNSLISVTLDGRFDLIAGLSHGENVTGLVATLPDRIVYVRPSQKHERNAISIVSRPYSALSGLVRGILAMPTSRSRSSPYYLEKVRGILDSQDASQGSGALTDALIKNDLSPVAYLLAVSEQGRFNMPPLKRADFLGRIGDIRGALSTAETEYAKLPNAQSFSEGTELYRLIQRILNMAFASGDFAVGRRCSALLGRRGTFSAFVDAEGGYAAVTSLAEYARRTGNPQIAEVLIPLIEKSALSCVATDSSRIPSPEEMRNTREAVQSLNPTSISLGQADRSSVFISVPPRTDEDGNALPRSRMELKTVAPDHISDRLEMYRRDVAVELAGDDNELYNTFHEGKESLRSSLTPGGGAHPQPSDGALDEGDSSDEDGFLNTQEDTLGQDVMPTHAIEYNAAAGVESALSPEVRQGAEETRKKLRKQREQMNEAMKPDRLASHQVMQSQRLAQPTGAAIPDSRAVELRERGMDKFDSGRYARAMKDFEFAIRALFRGQERGHASPPELLHELVYYKMASRVRIAMEEIESSAHANTIAGRTTYAQLVTSLTGFPLRSKQRIGIMVVAVDANMMMNNFGTAARGLALIKEMGVPEHLRSSLREKYAICAARGFTNAQQTPSPALCYHSLRAILPGARELACTVCPARFLADAGLRIGDECSSCIIGKVVPL